MAVSIGELTNTEHLEHPEEMITDLQEEDLPQQRTFAADFCLRVAQSLTEAYTGSEKIQEIIQTLFNTKAGKKNLISAIVRFYNEVYKNNLLKTHIGKVYKKYNDELEHLGYDKKDIIEKNCIKFLAKLNQTEKLIGDIHAEFVRFFLNSTDKDLRKLIQLFLEDTFIDSIHKSALALKCFPEVLHKKNERLQSANEEKISKEHEKTAEVVQQEREAAKRAEKQEDAEQAEASRMAQHILFSIESIRHALREVMKIKKWEILTNKKSADHKEDTNHKKNVDHKEEAQVTLDPILFDYLNDILKTKASSVHENRNLFNQQMVCIPNLIEAMKEGFSKRHPEEAPKVPKETLDRALSMIEDIEPIPNNSNTQSFDTTKQMLIISTRLPTKQKCQCTKHEESAALINELPLVTSIIAAGSVRSVVLKSLRLVPGTIEKGGKYFIIIELSFALLGAAFATYTILHPNENRLLPRIWKTTLRALVSLVFGLGAAINVFLILHPEKQNISNEEFFEKIFLAPLILTTPQILWNMVDPLKKEIYFPRKTYKHILRLLFDISDNMGYHAGNIFFALTNFALLPKNLYQLCPLIPGLLVALGLQSSSFKEKLNMIMTFITGLIFSEILIRASLPGSPDREFEDNTHVVLRSITYFGLSAYSLGLLLNRHLRFITEYVNTADAAEIVAREINVKFKKGKLDTASLPQGSVLIDPYSYTELRENFSKGKMEKVSHIIDSAREKMKHKDTDEDNKKETILLFSKSANAKTASDDSYFTQDEFRMSHNEDKAAKRRCGCVIL